jgi:hypothetical protein
MALGINDLTPIQEVSVDTRFEGVVAAPDPDGRLGRKVSGKQIEVFANRAGGDVDLNIDAKVKVETDRAKGVEGALENLQTETKANLVAAVNEVKETADDALRLGKAAEKTLPKKANLIITPQIKTLSQADVGDVPGVVTFDTSQVPPAPSAAGSIVFADEGRFDLSASGDMTYTDAEGGVTEVITGGVWQTTVIDTGNSAIQSETNANSGAWAYGKWVAGETVIDLNNVNDKADTALSNAASAAQEAANAQRTAEAKADKIAALPDIIFGAVPFSVPAGRILAVNTSAVPVVTPAAPEDSIGFVSYDIVGGSHKFGAWTIDGGATTHFGHFDLVNFEIVNIQDWFNGEVWLSDNYLVKQGIDGQMLETLGTLAGLDIGAGGDISVLSQPAENLVDARGELFNAISELSINRLTRSEFEDLGVKYADVVDGLDSLDAKKPLSAKQGAVLKELIAGVNTMHIAGPYAAIEDIPTPYDDNDLYLVGEAAPYNIYVYSATLEGLLLLGSSDIDLSN